MELKNYQKRMVDKIKEQENLILSVGMGLGKTAAVLHAIDDLNPENVLIVSTKRIVETVWQQESEKWNLRKVHDKMVIVNGSTTKKEKLIKDESKPYKIISRDNLTYLTKFYTPKPNTWLIIDELTSFKNLFSKRTFAVLQIEAEKKIGLTGTIAANGMIDFFAQLAALSIEPVTFRKYGKTIYSPEFVKWRGLNFIDKNKNTPLNYPKWEMLTTVSEIIEPYKERIFTLDSADYSEIPENSLIFHDIPLGDKLRANYIEMAATLSVSLNENENIEIKENAVFCKLQTLCNGFIYDNEGISHRAEISPKLEAVADFCENAAAENESVLLLYAFVDECKWLIEMLNKRGLRVATVKDKNFLEKWNNREIDVLLGHPASIGHGLNLQFGGHIQVWSSVTYNFEFWAQANARLSRPGQKMPVQIHVFQAEKTLEASKSKILAKKNAVNKTFFNLTK